LAEAGRAALGPQAPFLTSASCLLIPASAGPFVAPLVTLAKLEGQSSSIFGGPVSLCGTTELTLLQPGRLTENPLKE
jgi:hypothetical protein